jgi:hypothetical protein
VGAILLVFGHDLLGSVSQEFDLGTVKLPAIPWRDCAIWTGWFRFRAFGSNSDNGYTYSVSSTTTANLDPQSSPPDYNIYPVTAPGSGSTTSISPWQCGNPAVDTTWTTKVNWSGTAMTTLGKPTIAFGVGAGPGDYVAQIYPAGYTYWTMPGGQTDDWHSTTPEGVCTDEHEEQSFSDWWQYVFAFVDNNGGMTDTVYFNLPAGATSATGTRSYPQNGNEPNLKLTYSITKHCLLGGTTCTMH